MVCIILRELRLRSQTFLKSILSELEGIVAPLIVFFFPRIHARTHDIIVH